MATKTGESDMKRIPPQDVVDAYIATGMYRCAPGLFEDHEGGVCGLSAVARTVDANLDASDESFPSLIGISEAYFWGFVDGFDEHDVGREEFAAERIDYEAGQEDGAAALKAVTAHFAKAPAEQPQEEIEHAH